MKPEACAEGWKCLGKWKKAYLNKNCNWSNETECLLGCVDGSCRVGKICQAGWKCSEGTKLGYQKEDCLWTNVKKCPGGCANATCLPVPEKNETNNTSKETVPPVIEEKAFTLFF